MRRCDEKFLGCSRRRQQSDISYYEDRCRITKTGGAEVMTSLRNLAIGLYEYQLDQDRTKALKALIKEDRKSKRAKKRFRIEIQSKRNGCMEPSAIK